MKTDYVKIRLTPQEKELLKEFAENLNMTMSDYIKYCCLLKPPVKHNTPKE
jgi:antitoxin component of RelBE/YafQ-DinJ toxin-antitoxin module